MEQDEGCYEVTPFGVLGAATVRSRGGTRRERGAVMFYSTDIFRTYVFDGNTHLAAYATAGVGVVNVIATCLSIWLV
ncbi:hypothetical protein AAVH_29079 [Aphelenchoides avenae]|nr:hypothetical protein AAVH_29079 [Aphelenchus avenae]